MTLAAVQWMSSLKRLLALTVCQAPSSSLSAADWFSNENTSWIPELNFSERLKATEPASSGLEPGVVGQKA